MFAFTDAGQFWTFVGAIGSIIVVAVAFFPILKEARHQKKSKTVFRQQILFSLETIHESYFGKVMSLIEHFQSHSDIRVGIPPTDHPFFAELESMYRNAAYLSNLEKNNVAQIIGIFRKSIYRNREGVSTILPRNILEIERLSYDTCQFIYRFFGSGLRDCRRESYERIIQAASPTTRPYPSYESIISVTRRIWN